MIVSYYKRKNEDGNIDARAHITIGEYIATIERTEVFLNKKPKIDTNTYKLCNENDSKEFESKWNDIQAHFDLIKIYDTQYNSSVYELSPKIFELIRCINAVSTTIELDSINDWSNGGKRKIEITYYERDKKLLGVLYSNENIIEVEKYLESLLKFLKADKSILDKK